MSKELEKNYNPSEIEDRLYQKWLDKKYFHAEVDRSKKPFTIVMPPPNITGKLHMGHALVSRAISGCISNMSVSFFISQTSFCSYCCYDTVCQLLHPL